jgi:hypothetical protein
MMIDEIVRQLRQERDRIDEAIRALAPLSGNTRILKVKAASPARSTGRRTMSAAARRKIAAAQRARWARVKAGEKG